VIAILDYETQPATFAAMKANGASGGVVYIAPAAFGYPKAVKLAQVVAAVAGGFPLAFNFEQGTSDYLNGYSRGVTHGAAIEQAMHELQQASTQPVYLSIDTNVMPAQFPIAADYFRGAQSATSHPLDVYGTTALAAYLAAQGLIRRHWQSESRGFFGNLVSGPHTVLIQNYGQHVGTLGGSYDVNQAVAVDWGQYPRPGGTTVTPSTTGDAMNFADKVLSAPFRTRTVAIVDPHTGDIVIVGDPNGIANTKPVQTGFGPVIAANYPAGEVFVTAVELDPNGFALISKLADGELAMREYQFIGKVPTPAPGPAPAPAPVDIVALSKLVAAHLKIDPV
jgi:hypothetical protein